MLEGHLGTRELKALGHLGTQAIEHSDTRRALRYTDTQAVKNLSTGGTGGTLFSRLQLKI